MKVIGIVGGIGAGKTTVVSIIQDCTLAHIIGADEIGHRILLKGESAYQTVVDTFGQDILDEQGFIIRGKLGQIVFGNKEKLKSLNAITHPLIKQEIEEEVRRCKQGNQYEFVVIDAALLIEVGLVSLTDFVIGVNADLDVRLKRIKQRDSYTEEQAMQRINKQKKWEELEKVVNYVIDNSKSYDITKEQVKGILKDVKSQGLK